MTSAKTWIVAANGDIARVFDYTDPETGPIPVTGNTWHATKGLEWADKQGHTKSRIGPSLHRMAPHTGPDPDHLSFAREIADKLENAHETGTFDRLVLCASPVMLGLLRQTLSGGVEKTLVAEVDKDLTHMPLEEFGSYMAERLDV